MRFNRPFFFLFPDPLAFFRFAALGELPHYKKDPSYATVQNSDICY